MAKTKSTKVTAKALGIHPGEFVTILATLGIEFDDAWPEVDEGLIQTISTMLKKRPAPTPIPKAAATLASAVKTAIETGQTQEPALTDGALYVLEKLYTRGKIDKHGMKRQSIKHQWGRSSHTFDNDFDLLLDRGLIIAVERDCYSVDSHRKTEIERLIRRTR